MVGWLLADIFWVDLPCYFFFFRLGVAVAERNGCREGIDRQTNLRSNKGGRETIQPSGRHLSPLDPKTKSKGQKCNWREGRTAMVIGGGGAMLCKRYCAVLSPYSGRAWSSHTCKPAYRRRGPHRFVPVITTFGGPGAHKGTKRGG